MPSRRPDLRIAHPAGKHTVEHREAFADATHGERLLAQQGLRGLREAVGRIRTETGWSHFWRGYVSQFDDLALARAEWLLAEDVVRARRRRDRDSS